MTSNNNTEEQLDIVNTAVTSHKNGENIYVLARAGTGKTTTLEKVAVALQKNYYSQSLSPNIVYVAFNASVATSFGNRICNNNKNFFMESKTMHALCMSAYLKKFGTNSNSIKVHDEIELTRIVDALNITKAVEMRYIGSQVRNPLITKKIHLESLRVAYIILKSFENYVNSDSIKVEDKHIYYLIRNELSFIKWCKNIDKLSNNIDGIKCNPAEDYYKKFRWKLCISQLFDISADNNSNLIPLVHSVYQKICQIEKLQLRLSNKYNQNDNDKIVVFLVDESQDWNDCQFDIFYTQIKNQKSIFLYVGDPAQSIYQFRGASTQFEKMCNINNILTLSESFRFGKNIEKICNILLLMKKTYQELVDIKYNNNSTNMLTKDNDNNVNKDNNNNNNYSNNNNNNNNNMDDNNLNNSNNKLKEKFIKVKGQESINDSIVSSDTYLDYPYTIICRTNNGTCYSLLSAIEEALLRDNSSDNNNDYNDNSPISVKRKRIESDNIHTSNSFNNNNDDDEITIQSPGTPANTQSALSITTKTPERRTNKSFYIIGVKDFSNLDKRILQKVDNITKISENNPFKHKQEIFYSLSDLSGYAEAVADNELIELIRMSQKWGNNIKSIRETIKYHYASCEERADVVLVTIHKAKGLEWDRVALGCYYNIL